LNRGILDVRLAAVLFIFLVGSVALIHAENLVVAAEQVSSKTPCSYCDSLTIEPEVSFTITSLNGKSKYILVADTLASQRYQTLKSIFIHKGYSQQVDEAITWEAEVETDTNFIVAYLVYIPFDTGCECDQLKRAWILSVFTDIDIFTVAVAGTRETTDEPWTVEYHLFDDDDGNLISNTITEDVTSDSPCFSECIYLCYGAAGAGCTEFASIVAPCCGPWAPVCWGIAWLCCMVGGYYICNGLCNCLCYGDCGSAPGCDQYPPCICDPYIDCE